LDLNLSNLIILGNYFEEILKDADCAHHALRNPMEDFFYTKERIYKVVDELIK